MIALKTALSASAAWAAGLASFGLLLNTLRDPVVPPAPIENAVAAIAVKPLATAAPRPVIELEPTVIVAAKPRRAVAASVEPTWNCSWRRLEQGTIGEQVRTCEPAPDR